MKRPLLPLVFLVSAACSAPPLLVAAPDPSPVLSPGWVTEAQLTTVAELISDALEESDVEAAMNLYLGFQATGVNCIFGEAITPGPDRSAVLAYAQQEQAGFAQAWEPLADALLAGEPILRALTAGWGVVQLFAACGGVAQYKPDPQGHRDQ